MILKFSNTSYKYNGRVQDEIWTSSGLRGIARTRIRPAKPQARFEYKALFSLAAARAAWVLLSSETQTEWNDLADSTFGWPLQGSPRYMDGETYFANYYTVLLAVDPAASVPDVPLSGPTWQSKPKFFEFATWENGVYTLKAETDFDADTRLLFSGLPPTKSGFKPDFAREVFIGTESLEFGLTENELYASVDAFMESTFGPIDITQKIWGRVWEIQNGYIRTIRDPCTTNPSEAPPAGNLELCIYNARAVDVADLIVDIYDDVGTVIGTADFGSLPGESQVCIEDTLDEGYTTDDVAEIYLFGEWIDFEFIDFLESYDDSNPWEFTIDLII